MANDTSSHELFMQRAFELAALGTGHVAPNPLVGAVVVYQGSILGEGWHRQYGQAHAEVNAINSVSQMDLLPACTMYVNLEPCAHFGKTPPCSLLLIEKKIKRVFIANTDPYSEVAGKGIQMLQKAGIEVHTGLSETNGRWLNRRFFTFHEKKRPYIILKWAQSADGFMAPDKAGNYWISSPESKTLLHKWRSEEPAILVGARTVLLDNPALNTRLIQGKSPRPVVIERSPGIHGHFKLFENPLLIRLRYQASLRDELPELLALLHEQQLQSVLVEGGAAVLNSFLQSGLWDEIRCFEAPLLLHNGLAAPAIPAEAQFIKNEHIGTDNLKLYTNINNQ
ncbi:MAG: bifunctional diaminohydroxyphosphoribosylaminopyrimidine deaminase/5-amino-6-(5-phosphoribosylamino)uracil reductase RibD [Bacteroidia bacterium]